VCGTVDIKNGVDSSKQKWVFLKQSRFIIFVIVLSNRYFFFLVLKFFVGYFFEVHGPRLRMTVFMCFLIIFFEANYFLIIV